MSKLIQQKSILRFFLLLYFSKIKNQKIDFILLLKSKNRKNLKIDFYLLLKSKNIFLLDKFGHF